MTGAAASRMLGGLGGANPPACKFLPNDFRPASEGKLSNGRWNLDSDEAIGREQVVLATLIDDSKVAIAFRIPVGQDRVDLVALE